MAYLLLAGAIVLEVMATINLRLSDGFTRLGPSILVVIGYLGAFGLLSQVLKAGVPVGIAYGIWAAAGVALVAIIGAVLLGDTLTRCRSAASRWSSPASWPWSSAPLTDRGHRRRGPAAAGARPRR